MPQRLPPAAQPRSRRARSGSLRKGRQQEGAEGGERRGETGSYGGKLKRDFPVPGCRAGKGCCEWGDRGKGGREGRASRPVPGCSGRRGAVWRGGPGRSRGDGHHCKNLGESRGEGGITWCGHMCEIGLQGTRVIAKFLAWGGAKGRRFHACLMSRQTASLLW